MADKILVVDDDLDTLRLVGLMLERQGYQIVAASSGEQSLTLAKKEHPDLILLDLMMPDIDGVEVARRLRADPETQDILIIMFTAKGQTEDKIEGFDAGADDYLTKPAQPRELIAHVKAVLKRSRRPASAPKAEFKERGQLVGVISVKGGVGVSTMAINLGIALHQYYKKSVVVADFRPGCGTIGLELGYSMSQGLSRLLSSNPAEIDPYVIDQELAEHSSGVQLLLSSPQPQDAKYINAVENFNAIARHLPYLAHYAVLDLGASLTPVNRQVLEHCDQIILVLEPVPQTVAQARLFLEYLSEQGKDGDRTLVALINRLRAGMQLPLGQVQDQLGRNISAIFTAAPELAYQAVVNYMPMILRQSDGITAQQFTSLAEKIKPSGK
ncbi:MAG: response regulator [Anaerolineales bacterium]|nr:response regulator [Anaerolineales bacterium]